MVPTQRLILAILFVVIMATPTLAQQTSVLWTENCRLGLSDEDDESSVSAGLCYGFIYGWLNAEKASETASPHAAPLLKCMPGNVSIEQMARTWVEYVEGKPVHLQAPPYETFPAALMTAYPCI